ncbi:putative transposase for insertion sequence isrm17 [Lentisphaera araneosa HTCC2155]|uniref:Putative transposase for insertion sequence isrm17 n=1 Tax=Lentisphaera araneosa HTCC2155 TaxID=313628 RepID=A6DJ60_9BACT|nr:ISNCY-like element ISLar6 family transposase [Lentisphaera araneosa]EDM28496.1 putative transposase for insertion sequence isrm17 [Lentisphaera araneosa HTCC2155]
MNDTLFSEYFIGELQQTAGILSGPLKIAGEIILLPEFEGIRKAIESDQFQLSMDRAATKNREFKNGNTKKHPPAELVVALFIARHFYNNCYGERGYSMLCENSSLHQFIGRLGIGKFPSRNTIHEQISALSEHTLTLFHQAILNCVKACDLDDFSAVIIDSTAIKADSSWPVDSALLKNLSCKVMKNIQKVHDKLPCLERRGIPLKRLQNYCDDMSNLDFVISMFKGKKGAKKMRYKSYTQELLPRCRKFITRLEKVLPKIKQHCSSIKSSMLDEDFSRFIDKVLMVEHRFKMAPEDYDAKTARKIYSMSDDDAAFIKKGGRETVFGYRPNFAFSANGFLTSFILESGNTSDSKVFADCLVENKKMTGESAMMVSVDDGYSSATNLDYAIEQGVELVSISGSKGKKLLGEEIYESENYQLARNIRSISEAGISKMKNYHNLERFTVCGLKRVRQETLISTIGFNLERLYQLLSQIELQVAA